MIGNNATIARWARPVVHGVWIVTVLTGATSCIMVSPTEPIAHSRAAHVSPALRDPSRRTLKRKVIIARFSNETLRGKSVLMADSPDLIPRQASDILSTRLARSGKVVLFEGLDSEVLLAALNEGRLFELGLPADFLILGSVTEFSRETLTKRGFFGSKTKRQRARARVNLRLVDVQSSRVIFSDEGIGEAESEVGTVLGIGTRSGYDRSLDGKAISAAISKLVNNLVENLLDQPWRSAVLSLEGEELMIAGSRAEGLAEGDRLAVLLRGRTVFNPRTGSPVELPGKKVATIEVVSLVGDRPETSVARCRLAAGSLPVPDPAAYVVEEEE